LLYSYSGGLPVGSVAPYIAKFDISKTKFNLHKVFNRPTDIHPQPQPSAPPWHPPLKTSQKIKLLPLQINQLPVLRDNQVEPKVLKVILSRTARH
jgi:hypothetical protein